MKQATAEKRQAATVTRSHDDDDITVNGAFDELAEEVGIDAATSACRCSASISVLAWTRISTGIRRRINLLNAMTDRALDAFAMPTSRRRIGAAAITRAPCEDAGQPDHPARRDLDPGPP